MGKKEKQAINKEDLQGKLKELVTELLDKSGLTEGQVLVVGCSTSEVLGSAIGSQPSDELGEWIFEAIYPILKERGIYLAAQCCEHYNRALVVEASLPNHPDQVNAIPKRHAGGSFAAAAYHGFDQPILVEHIRADAGLDIGDTLIGMHMKEVCVPVRLKLDQLGSAHVTAARVRPKYIGGERAIYDEKLK